MTRLLESTLGKAAVFWVDLLCGLADRALYFFEDDDDDFNIAVIRGGRMVAVLWMEDDLDEEPGVIDQIADALGVIA